MPSSNLHDQPPSHSSLPRDSADRVHKPAAELGSFGEAFHHLGVALDYVLREGAVIRDPLFRAGLELDFRLFGRGRGGSPVRVPIPMKPPLCSEMIAPPVSGMISPPV